MCTALDQAGNVVLSTDPTYPGDWMVAYAEPPDSPSGLNAVGCRSSHFCFGTDNWGNFLASTYPAAGQSAWTATGLHAAGTENGPDATLDHMISEVACSSPSACILKSIQKRLFSTADPAVRAPDWRPAGLAGVNEITCAAMDGVLQTVQTVASTPRPTRRAETAGVECSGTSTCPAQPRDSRVQRRTFARR